MGDERATSHAACTELQEQILAEQGERVEREARCSSLSQDLERVSAENDVFKLQVKTLENQLGQLKDGGQNALTQAQEQVCNLEAQLLELSAQAQQASSLRANLEEMTRKYSEASTAAAVSSSPPQSQPSPPEAIAATTKMAMLQSSSLLYFPLLFLFVVTMQAANPPRILIPT